MEHHDHTPPFRPSDAISAEQFYAEWSDEHKHYVPESGKLIYRFAEAYAANLRSSLTAAREEIARLKSVHESCLEWQGGWVTKDHHESALATLQQSEQKMRKALHEIEKGDADCECDDHEHETCCNNQGDVTCPHCIAGEALASSQPATPLWPEPGAAPRAEKPPLGSVRILPDEPATPKENEDA